MKKKIISYIALVTLVSSISLIFIFSDLIKQNELNSEKATIETMLNQMIVNLENNQEARDKARQLFTEDYLNRAGFTKYLISIDKYKDFSENDWKEINGLVDVTAIYLGKDKDGRYNFFDGGGACGTFKMTKNFIMQRDIKITNKLDEEKSYDLYVELKKYQNKMKDKHKDRDSR